MKLPRFLANSYLTDADNSEFDYDDSDFFHSNPDDYVEHFKVIFNDYNTNVVEIKDVSTNKVYTFKKYTFEMGSYMEEDVLEYTYGGYQEGKYSRLTRTNESILKLNHSNILMSSQRNTSSLAKMTSCI